MKIAYITAVEALPNEEKDTAGQVRRSLEVSVGNSSLWLARLGCVVAEDPIPQALANFDRWLMNTENSKGSLIPAKQFKLTVAIADVHTDGTFQVPLQHDSRTYKYLFAGSTQIFQRS